MSKIKRKENIPKVQKATVKRGGDCPQMPAFSFEFLTANKSYNLSYFPDAFSRREASEGILLRLSEICSNNWQYWHSLGKARGLEMLPIDRLRFSPSGKNMSFGDKVIIFRVKGYAGKEARIIGSRQEGCPILFILGFDFDFSAYDHD